MILLTEDERDKVLDSWGLNPGGRDYSEELNKAQLKKVVEWLDGDCTEHPHPVYPTGIGFSERKECPDCWQALLKEANMIYDEN